VSNYSKYIIQILKKNSA